MEQVGISKLWSFVDGASKAEIVTNGRVRQDAGFAVADYMDLAARVAELQYRNRNHVLFFRRQSGDWRSVRGFTTLKPTLFRPPSGRSRVSAAELTKRFTQLAAAELLLAYSFKTHKRLAWQRLARDRLLRWSILQHYEVCPTPLLDVTHSLRIAASFASLGGSDEAFLYVLAVPNLSGAITANAESGLQVIRLASVCPPAAIRPHIQEGYLLGEYPDMADTLQSQHYKAHELDLGRRIVAKFRFKPTSFWDDDTFPQVSHAALYPKGRDWLERLADDIAAKVT
jgi:hypothetical protein